MRNSKIIKNMRSIDTYKENESLMCFESKIANKNEIHKLAVEQKQKNYKLYKRVQKHNFGVFLFKKLTSKIIILGNLILVGFCFLKPTKNVELPEYKRHDIIMDNKGNILERTIDDVSFLYEEETIANKFDKPTKSTNIIINEKNTCIQYELTDGIFSYYADFNVDPVNNMITLTDFKKDISYLNFTVDNEDSNNLKEEYQQLFDKCLNVIINEKYINKGRYNSVKIDVDGFLKMNENEQSETIIRLAEYIYTQDKEISVKSLPLIPIIITSIIDVLYLILLYFNSDKIFEKIVKTDEELTVIPSKSIFIPNNHNKNIITLEEKERIIKLGDILERNLTEETKDVILSDVEKSIYSESLKLTKKP